MAAKTIIKPVRVTLGASGDKTEHYEVRTVEEAQALVKRAQSIHLHARMPGWVNDTQYYADHFTGGIKVERSAALAWLADAFRFNNKAGAWLSVRLTSYTRTPRYDYSKGKTINTPPHRTMWIG